MSDVGRVEGRGLIAVKQHIVAELQQLGQRLVHLIRRRAEGRARNKIWREIAMNVFYMRNGIVQAYLYLINEIR